MSDNIRDMLANTNEQKILAALLRIEALLMSYLDNVAPTGPVEPLETVVKDITPTKTSFMNSIPKGRRSK